MQNQSNLRLGRRTLLAGAVGALLLLNSCAGLESGEPPRGAELADLTAGAWTVKRIDRAFPAPRTKSRFEFSEDGRFEGNGGAADLFGRFTIDAGGVFEVERLQSMLLGLPADTGAPGAAPEGLGSENLVSQQELIERALREADRAEVWRGRLMISTNGRTTLELAPLER